MDQIDPAAVRRTQTNARNRDVVLGDVDEKSGTILVTARLSSTDGALFDRRVQAMAHGVCEDDPRNLGQRRSDAMGALGAGSFHLTCLCGNSACPAATDDGRASKVIVHVVAEQHSLTAHPDPLLHGDHHTAQPRPAASAPQRVSAPKREQRPPEAPGTQEHAKQEQPHTQSQAEPESEPETQPQPVPPVRRKAAIIPGGGIVPAPLLADLIARGATVKPVRTPGPQPEPRYRPSAALALFVRTRDLTCRFPGCDRPAESSDLDHTTPYPHGPTHAGGLGCKCRKHHLVKTFWDGWSEQQLPDGTIIVTTPTGHAYTTKPGAALLFPGWNTTTPAPPTPPGPLRDPSTVVPPKSWRVSYAAFGLVLDSLIS